MFYLRVKVERFIEEAKLFSVDSDYGHEQGMLTVLRV